MSGVMGLEGSGDNWVVSKNPSGWKVAVGPVMIRSGGVVVLSALRTRKTSLFELLRQTLLQVVLLCNES